MKTLYNEFNAGDMDILSDIHEAVDAIFKKYAEYNPREVSHAITSCAYTTECETVLIAAMKVSKARREEGRKNMEARIKAKQEAEGDD